MTIPTWPSSSPHHLALKWLLWAIFGCAIAAPLLQIFGGIPTSYYLALSPASLSRGFYWTLLTYPFSYPAYNLLDLVFRLGIDLLLLWVFGVPVINRIASKHFLTLFFGGTLAGGLAATAVMYGLHSPFLNGLSPALMAIYTAWAILHAKETSRLSPARFPWIVGLLIGGALLLDLMARHWANFFANFASVLFGYFFCIIAEKAVSTIRPLRPLEHGIHKAIERLHTRKKTPADPKVIDFKTGKPLLDDDQFMDAMLARISLYGEEVLSPQEKNRMRVISEKKSIKK
jgi:membrane associated rhomboid family serine protease